MISLKPYTEKNVLYLIIFILIATTLFDIITALKNPIFRYGETNPIYLLTGFNTFIMTFITILITGLFCYLLKNSITLKTIFLITLATFYLIFGHIYGGISNINGEKEYNENPEKAINYYKSITTEEKYTHYFTTIFSIMFLPFFISYLAFSITLYFHNQRKPEREKIIDKISDLSLQLK